MRVGQFGGAELLGREAVPRVSDGQVGKVAHRGRLLDHFRHQEEVVVGRWRVLGDLLRDLAIRDLVGTLLHAHRRHRRHRLDALDVDLGQLLDEGQNGVELALEVLDLVLGDGDARQMGNAPDGGGVNGHAILRIDARKSRAL